MSQSVDLIRTLFVTATPASGEAPTPPPTPPGGGGDPPPAVGEVTDGLVAALKASAMPSTGAFNVPNTLATAPATKNISAYPFGHRDDDGGGTPTRTRYTTFDTDPLGLNEATKMDFGGASVMQQWFEATVNSGVSMPSTGYTMRAVVKAPTASVGEAYYIGQLATSRTAFTGPADWTPVTHALTAYTGTSAIGLSKNGANIVTPAVLLLHTQQLYRTEDVTGGFPTAAEERAAIQAMHGKKAYAFPGSITKNANGSMNLDGTTAGGLIIPHRTAPAAEALTEFTWILAAKVDGIGSGDAQGNLLCADHEVGADPNARAALAQLCVTTAGDFEAQPTVTMQADTKSAWKLFGEGPMTFAFAYKNGDFAVFVNGVLTSWTQSTVQTLYPRAWRMFSYMVNNTKSRQGQERIVGEFYDAYFWPRRLTNDEIIQHSVWLDGDVQTRYSVTPANRRLMLIGCGDSLTAFSNTGTRSWFWQLKDARGTLPYNLPMICEAVGGSALYPSGDQTQTNYWLDPRTGNTGYLGTTIGGRRTRLLQRVRAAVAAGYTPLVTFLPTGANDFAQINDYADGPSRYLYGGFATSTYGTGGFVDFVQSLRALGAIVWVGTTLRQIETKLTEAKRLAFNNALKALEGTVFDKVIDTGAHAINDTANWNSTYWAMSGSEPTVHYNDAGGAALLNDLIKPAIITLMNATT